MQRDFKIGLLLGVIIVCVAGVWLSVSPAVSVRARLRRMQNSKTGAESKLTNRGTRKEQTENIELKRESETRFHTVAKGETLYEIAIKYYGSATKWTKIGDANPKIDVKKLQPGTTLIIPP